MENLTITMDDASTIANMYAATLKAENGYTGPVMVDANRMYELHKKQAKEITRMWLIFLKHNARKAK